LAPVFSCGGAVLSVLKTSSTLRPSPHPHDASSLTLYIHPLLLHHPKMVFPLICTSFIYTHCSVHCPSNVLFLFLYLFSYIHGVSFHPQFKPRRDGADLIRRSAATSAAFRRHGITAVRAGDTSAAPDVSEQAQREFDDSKRSGADRLIPFIRLAGRREVAW
jgi:hypothetical protein